MGSGLTPLQRLFFFPWGWVLQYPTRFMLMLIPVVYFWFGLLPLHITSIEDVLWFQLPVFVAYFLMMKWLVPQHYLPILSTAQGFFATFRLLPTVISSLLRPFGKPFRVTPKGSLNTAQEYDRFTFWFILCIVLASAGGVLINLFPETQILEKSEFYPLALLWAVFNIITLLVAMLMCFDRPRARTEERFIAGESATLHGKTNRKVRLYDLSLTGARVSFCEFSEVSHLSIRDVGRVPVNVVQSFPWKAPEFLTLEFQHSRKTRRKLTRKLFSGQYAQSVGNLNVGPIAKTLFSRMFGA